ncbi:MAG: DDE-type integrase/transposase/recombinase [Actinomycetia bacterium]|nr:DDE-type integrase/transposase/recombinase [Actinomycetes bacterium]
MAVYRWVQRFTPLLINAAQPCRHAVGDRWFVDKTYAKANGVWRYVYRAVDQHGQVIDIYVSKRPNITAATHFIETMLTSHGRPAEVTTDLAAPLLRVVEELIPEAAHDTKQYANNRIEWDHGRLRARPRPMRGLSTDRTASIVIRGHGFVQSLRRGHYELGAKADRKHLRLAAAFDELADVI